MNKFTFPNSKILLEDLHVYLDMKMSINRALFWNPNFNDNMCERALLLLNFISNEIL